MASRPPVFPHEAALTRQIYAAQAAAARRKRRRVRARQRSQQQKQQQLQRSQQQQPHTNNNATTKSSKNDDATPAAEELRVQAFTQAGKRARLLELVQPDVRGIQLVAHRLSQGQNVAVPTECTYELLQPHSAFPCPLLSPTNVPAGNKTTRHVYVTDISVLETSTFWKQMLARKTYAIKASATVTSPTPPRRARSNSMISPATLSGDNSTMEPQPSAIATFNETIQVIRRIAPKVWPGPVLLYIQVSQPVAGITITVGRNGEQCYTSESNVQHYLALRMACHPLTVKVCNEFYQQQQQQQTHQQYRASPPPSPARPKTPPSLTSSPCLSRSGSSSSMLSVLASSQILVGYPMRDKTDSFITAADQVSDSATTTVLNGEERREIFCVPTCEYGQPCQVALWMDADRRTVRVERRQHAHRSSSLDRLSPDSVVSGTVISESALLQSLRGTTLKPKNAVERVIQAVLLKWKVVDQP